MLFSTKGRTLLNLKSKGFNVPKLILIKKKNFVKYPDKIIDQIYNEFSQLIAIRSSAGNEDSNNESLAGKYQSFLNINPKNKKLVRDCLNRISSDFDNKFKNEIIIQNMVNKSVVSGVCTTVDLHNYLPIININYDETDKTDTVTSGKKNSHTLTIFDDKVKKIKNKKIFNFIKEVKKLKSKLISWFPKVSLN